MNSFINEDSVDRLILMLIILILALILVTFLGINFGGEFSKKMKEITKLSSK